MPLVLLNDIGFYSDQEWLDILMSMNSFDDSTVYKSKWMAIPKDFWWLNKRKYNIIFLQCHLADALLSSYNPWWVREKLPDVKY